MKVVLKQDVDNLGARGQVVEVAAGFARNYLLPKGLALEATPGNLKTLELRKKAWAAREERQLEDARDLAARLSAVRLTVAKKAGEHDTLYGSVTPAEIAERLASLGFDVDRRRIQLAEPIKSLGTYSVPVRIHRDVVAEVAVEVVAERA